MEFKGDFSSNELTRRVWLTVLELSVKQGARDHAPVGPGPLAIAVVVAGLLVRAYRAVGDVYVELAVVVQLL